MNAYAPPPVDDTAPKLLTSRDIDKLFRRTPGWFARDRTRKRLYDKGFPHPCERGRWSPLAVKNWMAGAGSNPDAVPPDRPRRRRRRSSSSNGYATP